MISNKYAAGAVVAGSMLVGAVIGVAVFAPHLAGATSGPTPTVTNSTPAPSASNGTAFHSNEDPAHEAAESPQREAEENSGQGWSGGHDHGGRGFGHGGGSNEDPTHEANESPERENQENANTNGTQTAPPATSNSGASTLS